MPATTPQAPLRPQTKYTRKAMTAQRTHIHDQVTLMNTRIYMYQTLLR